MFKPGIATNCAVLYSAVIEGWVGVLWKSKTLIGIAAELRSRRFLTWGAGPRGVSVEMGRSKLVELDPTGYKVKYKVSI